MATSSLSPAFRAVISTRPSTLTTARRHFHSTPTFHASVLFALSALSNSRETQHFNKLTRLSRVEHSPPLELIQSSEVDPFPCPTPPRTALSPPLPRGHTARSAARVWDHKALSLGRAILTSQARHAARLTRALARAKRRQTTQTALSQLDRIAWQKERRKLRNDLRAAGVWILVSIGTATALATWRFWPEREPVVDSAELGRKIAARAAAAMRPLPPAVRVEPTVSAPVVVPVERAAPVASTTEMRKTRATQTDVAVPGSSSGSWWRSLFWKES